MPAEVVCYESIGKAYFCSPKVRHVAALRSLTRPLCPSQRRALVRLLLFHSRYVWLICNGRCVCGICGVCLRWGALILSQTVVCDKLRTQIDAAASDTAKFQQRIDQLTERGKQYTDDLQALIARIPTK